MTNKRTSCFTARLTQKKGTAHSMWQPYPLPDAPTVIHVRTRLPLAAARAAVQRQVQALDPNLPLFDVGMISQRISDSYWRQRVSGWWISVFAGLALVLSMAGVYSVTAYVVIERTHEIGIRMALGADGVDMVRMMVRDGLTMIACGTTIGTAAALTSAQLLKSLLYGVGPNDPLTFAAVAVLFALVALAASYIPARRASRVDPMVALRYE